MAFNTAESHLTNGTLALIKGAWWGLEMWGCGGHAAEGWWSSSIYLGSISSYYLLQSVEDGAGVPPPIAHTHTHLAGWHIKQTTSVSSHGQQQVGSRWSVVVVLMVSTLLIFFTSTTVFLKRIKIFLTGLHNELTFFCDKSPNQIATQYSSQAIRGKHPWTFLA